MSDMPTLPQVPQINFSPNDKSSGPPPPKPSNPFPEDKAQKIIEWAKSLGVAGVAEILNQIRDVIGHPSTVINISKEWSNVEIRLSESWEKARNLPKDTARWEGAAKNAFDGWCNTLKSSLSSTANGAEEMARAVMQMHNTIIEAYNALIEYITQIYTHFQDMGADIIGSIADVLGGGGGKGLRAQIIAKIASDITHGLMDFVRATSQFIQATIRSFGDFQRTEVLVNSAEADVAPPGTYMKTVAPDPGHWDVADRNA